MKPLEREAILIRLIKALVERGSWCGETLVQKSAYFLQVLLQVPTGFNFILYKHGPFAFDLRDELSAMVTDGFISLKPRYPGHELAINDSGERLLKKFAGAVGRFDSQIIFVADELGCKGVVEIEKLGTALYISNNHPSIKGDDARAGEITRLKPHISLEEAKTAVAVVDELQRNAKDLVYADAGIN